RAHHEVGPRAESLARSRSVPPGVLTRHQHRAAVDALRPGDDVLERRSPRGQRGLVHDLADGAPAQPPHDAPRARRLRLARRDPSPRSAGTESAASAWSGATSATIPMRLFSAPSRSSCGTEPPRATRENTAPGAHRERSLRAARPRGITRARFVASPPRVTWL